MSRKILNGFQIAPQYAMYLCITWLLVIFFLSHQPGNGPGELLAWLPGEVKNLLHIPSFGLLAFLIWHSLKERLSQTFTLNLTTLSLVLLYGVLDEWHQSFIPGRVSSISDIVNDLIGGMLAITITTMFLRYNSEIS